MGSVTILEGHGFSIYDDDGLGKPQRVEEVPSNVNFDTTVLPGGQWFLLDTYPLNGYQYVVLYHRASRLFVPLAKLKNTAQVGTIHRVDIHARASRDGRNVCIDSSHEGLGHISEVHDDSEDRQPAYADSGRDGERPRER